MRDPVGSYDRLPATGSPGYQSSCVEKEWSRADLQAILWGTERCFTDGGGGGSGVFR